MNGRLEQLDELHSIISRDPKNTPKETRKQFWRLVREIKREAVHNDLEVVEAAKIRDVLFEADRGRTIALSPALVMAAVLGFVGICGYIWALQAPLNWARVLSWGLSDWEVFALRFFFVFAVIATLYPFGRVIAAKWAGIRLMGMCRDQYYEPTLKIDYVTFLKASPPKRKWFFFFSGIWTVITALWLGAIGLLLDLDFTAFIVVFFLVSFEGYVVVTGGTKPSNGEMGHFNRERRIEQEWRRNLSSVTRGLNDGLQ